MSLIKCPECRQEISDQAKKCIHCGKELFHCPECGKITVRHGNTCPQCGYVLPEAPKPAPIPAPVVTPAPVAAPTSQPQLRQFLQIPAKERKALFTEFETRNPNYPIGSTGTKAIIFGCIAILIIIPIIMVITGLIIRHEKKEHYFDDKPYAFAGLEGFTDDELIFLCRSNNAERISYVYHDGNTYLLFDEEINEYNKIGWPLLGTSIAILVIYAPVSITFWILAHRIGNKAMIYQKIFQAWLLRNKQIDYQLPYIKEEDKKKVDAIDLTKYPFS